MGREAEKRLTVGKKRSARELEECGVPHTEKAQKHRNVAVIGSGTHVRIDCMCSSEEIGHDVIGIVNGERQQADRRTHRIAASDPVPEAEDIGGIDAEGRDSLDVRRHGAHVVRDDVFWRGLSTT